MSKSDGALNSYLRKVGQVRLLTPNDEIELGRKIRNGDAAAREQMIRANLRLVVTIARDYVNFGLPLPDLISEGNIGLMEAVGRFDPGNGSRTFVTAPDEMKRFFSARPGAASRKMIMQSYLKLPSWQRLFVEPQNLRSNLPSKPRPV